MQNAGRVNAAIRDAILRCAQKLTKNLKSEKKKTKK